MHFIDILSKGGWIRDEAQNKKQNFLGTDPVPLCDVVRIWGFRGDGC